LIFNYSDLIIILPFCVLFTADRKNTAGWLVGNSMIKRKITFTYEAHKIRSTLNQTTRAGDIHVINSFFLSYVQQYETQGATSELLQS